MSQVMLLSVSQMLFLPLMQHLAEADLTKSVQSSCGMPPIKSNSCMHTGLTTVYSKLCIAESFYVCCGLKFSRNFTEQQANFLTSPSHVMPFMRTRSTIPWKLSSEPTGICNTYNTFFMGNSMGIQTDSLQGKRQLELAE